MSERIIDSDLEILNKKILTMGNLVEQSISNSIYALKERNKALALKVIDSDSIIDNLENEIDNFCIELLATKQPVASDLRFITTAMKITNDLERIADLAVDISQKNIEILSEPLLKPLIDIPKLSEIAQIMIRLALNSFISRNTSKLSSITDFERKADKLRDAITDELVDIIYKDSTTVKKAIPLLLIARYLERICDHAMNIAEDVVYMVEAKVIKHSKRL